MVWEPEGEPLARELREGESELQGVGVPVALPLGVRDGENVPQALGDGLGGPDPVPPLNEDEGLPLAEPEGVPPPGEALRLPGTSEGVLRAVDVALRLGEALIEGEGEGRAVRVPTSGEGVLPTVVEALAVGAADTLTLRVDAPDPQLVVVPLGLPEREGEKEDVPVGRGLPEGAAGVPVARSAVPEGELLTLHVALPGAVPETLAVTVPHKEGEGVWDGDAQPEECADAEGGAEALSAPVSVGAAEEEGVARAELLPAPGDNVALPVEQGVPVAVGVTKGEMETEAVVEDEALGGREAEGQGVALGESDALPVADALPEGDTLTVHEALFCGEDVGLRVAPCEGETLLEGTGERDAEGQPLGLGEGDVLAVGDALTRAVGVNVAQPVTEADGSADFDALPEKEGEPEWDAHAEGEEEGMGVGELEGHKVGEDVPSSVREAHAVAQALRVEEGEAHGVAVCEWVPEEGGEPLALIVPLGQPEGLHVGDASAVAVSEPEREPVREGDAEGEAQPE